MRFYVITIGRAVEHAFDSAEEANWLAQRRRARGLASYVEARDPSAELPFVARDASQIRAGFAP